MIRAAQIIPTARVRCMLASKDRLVGGLPDFWTEAVHDPERSFQVRRSTDIPALPNMKTAYLRGDIVQLTR
jgi:hypothetical protein